MPAEATAELDLEIGHILFIDTVGYSKLLLNEQRRLLDKLKSVVRATTCFQTAEAAGKLIRLPTGDGMALVFADDPQAPVRCAVEISRAVRDQSDLPLRMGIHSGPISRVVDVNDRTNIAGAGINTAQRVMNCGDAGHILLSRRAADDLAEYDHWTPYLHPVGECEVKHGAKIGLVNLYTSDVGNPELPSVLQQPVRPRQQPTRLRLTPRVLVSAAAVLVIAAGLIGYGLMSRRPVGKFTNKSIAVLPFQTLTDEKQNAFLADAIVDEILTDLAKVADLKVISRTSVMQYKAGPQRNVREVAEALGVAYILEGTVQQVGDQIRLNSQLIDARTDAHVWAQSYDRKIADVFALESELAEAIVAQLQSKLSTEEKAAIERQPTSDLTAYNLYIRARTLLSASVFTLGGPNRLEALRLLQEAVTRDPHFLRAYFTMARIHSELYLLGFDHSPARLAQADQAYRAALRLQPDAGETHLAAAFLFYCRLDYEHAQQELLAAQRSMPNEPLGFEIAGYIERRQGHWKESEKLFRRALDLDPRNFYFLQQLAQSYEKQRRFGEMRDILNRALAVVPDDPGARMNRASIDVYERASTAELHRTLAGILQENLLMKDAVAVDLVSLGLCERDFSLAEQGLQAMPATGGNEEAFVFPRAWYAGLIARSKGDGGPALKEFTSARSTVEKIVEEQPNYAQAVSVLAMIDAALGERDRAIAGGVRATELLSVEKDAINGPLIAGHLAVTYAWCGENDRAVAQLSRLIAIPGDINFGRLQLEPRWDVLRNDPQFQRLLGGLAPK